MKLPPRSTLFPYTTLFRSLAGKRTSAFFCEALVRKLLSGLQEINNGIQCCFRLRVRRELAGQLGPRVLAPHEVSQRPRFQLGDRKSTRLNSSHSSISYAVF